MVAVELVRDEAPGLIEAKIEGRPMKIAGRLTARSVTRLEEADGGTKILYETDLSLTGKLGSLGRPVLAAKAKGMEVKKLSGTKFRQMLRAGEDIPEWFAFKSVVAVLRAEWK